MNDIIEIRRIRVNKPSLKFADKLVFRCTNIEKGRFTIYSSVAKLLNVTCGSAIMFSISKSNNCGFIYKEDVQKDSYILNEYDKINYRFCSSELSRLFKNVFNITDKECYFEVEPIQNDKGQYMFKLIN